MAEVGSDTRSAFLGATASGATRSLRWLLLLGSDLAGLFLAGTVAYLLWALPVREQSAELYLGLAPLLVLFGLGYTQAGLYPGFGLGPVEVLRRLSLVTATGFLVLASISFAFKLPYLYSRMTFGLALILSLVLVPILRFSLLRWAAHWSWWQEPVVLVGDPEEAEKTLDALTGSATAIIGYRPEGLLVPGSAAGSPRTSGPLPILGGLDAAEDLARRGVRAAILMGAVPPERTLDHLQTVFQRVVLLRGYGELPVEGLQVRNLGGVLGVEVTNHLLRPHNRMLKRGLDLAVGGLSFLLALPILGLAALAVKLVDRGSAFFVQERAGLGGETIQVPKIRTMYVDAEERLQVHLEADPAKAREWRDQMKLQDDPRVLPGVGSFLRRFSLDELPQLWSVLKGEMSLVGPRPFPVYHLDRFTPEFLELRHRVRPGLTGLWQVTSRSDGGLHEQEAQDTYYIRNWSLWLDLYVLGRTLEAVVSGRGAY